MRKEGFSQEWLDNSSFLDIFDKYIYMSNRNLIEKANYWFTSKLRDVEQKVNEKITGADGEQKDRSEKQKDKLRTTLYKEYFKETKQNESRKK